MKRTVPATGMCNKACCMLTFIIVLLTCACSRPVMSNDEAVKWIAGYTPARIDVNSPVRIELTGQALAKLVTGLQSDEIFSFSPSLEGTVRFSPDRIGVVDFVPDKPLAQGRSYECRVHLAALTGIDSLADFRFGFEVVRHLAQLRDVRLGLDHDDAGFVKLSGTVIFNTAEAAAQADSSAIACICPGGKITLSAPQKDNSRNFAITGIARRDKDFDLKIGLNKKYGKDAKEYSVRVPAISAFNLISAEKGEGTEPFFVLEFSTPLDTEQEPEGLITFDEVEPTRIERQGATVKVFLPTNAMPNLTLRISSLLRNRDGRRLGRDIEQHFEQKVLSPDVEILAEGNILPDDGNLRLPFRAVNLAAVDVEVVKVFPGNVMNFFLENDLDGTAKLRRYGRLIYHRTVRLDKDPKLDLHSWQNFAIDLKQLFRSERGAIYNVRLTYRRAYSLYGRTKAEDFAMVQGITDEDREEWNENLSYISREAPDMDWREYNFNENDDPSTPSYYMCSWRMPEINVLASDLGLIAKSNGDKGMLITATHLGSASPAAGIHVTGYNYQLQKIATATTDAKGFATLNADAKPYIITATDGRSTTYLKISTYNALMLSHFDVSGTLPEDGIKGFVYGERGVWRPGDVIHLALIVEDRNHSLPTKHPVVVELSDPSDKLYARQTIKEGVNGFYVCHIPTEESVPTGQWEARFKLGNKVFSHKVHIETIKPNRLKININAPELIQTGHKVDVGLSANWLTGPVAANMPATIELTLVPDKKPFGNYENYTFTNPLTSYNQSTKLLLEGRTDSTGTIRKNCVVDADINAPSLLTGNLVAKVSEPGGGYSIRSKAVKVAPFGVYVGLDLRGKNYETDTPLQFPVVVLNQVGARMKTRELSYKIYKLGTWWWWESGDAATLKRFVNSTSAEVVAQGHIKAINGYASVPFRVDYPDWGCYLVLVRDIKGGHASGGIVTVDWPDWRGRAERDNAAGSTELSFTLDKTMYKVGETAKVFLPQCAGGRVLLSIENGNKVLRRVWVNTSADRETCYKLPVDKSMTPNFYLSATMLRPHAATVGGVPLRQFGVVGATVTDPSSVLHPIIDMPDELRPGKPFTIKVGEADRRPMTYTLAIVDEGLLDITNFRTPRPWTAMNQKVPLGVRTWDMYDNVIGAFGAGFRSILSVGGDEALREGAGKEKRFNPVVKFMGPFTTDGRSKSHSIVLPNYVGSVRVMVVAAQNGSYGHTDKSVKVNAPLMLIDTLPRTLKCGDILTMPVNILAMEAGPKTAGVKVETSGPVSLCGAAGQTVKLTSGGDAITAFRLKCSSNKEGTARIIIRATGDGFTAADTMYIDVRNPMPTYTESSARTLTAGQSATLSIPACMAASLQISAMPTINFDCALNFMEGYAHLCTEQLSSKALFMLFGADFLEAETRIRCDAQLPKLLKAIVGRRLPDGGFPYWSSHTEANPWVSAMAGVVLAEASRRGFIIEESTRTQAIKYLTDKARAYRYEPSSALQQAMRLYALVRLGKPATADMNRLREAKQLSGTAAYCLASAYALNGRADVACSLLGRASEAGSEEGHGVFASDILNCAIAMEAYALCGKIPEALARARKLAADCNSARYVTQDVAFAAIAFHALNKVMGGGTRSVEVSEGTGTPKQLNNIANMRTLALSSKSGSVQVCNTGEADLELSLLTSSRPSANETVKPQANGVSIDIRYTDLNNKPLDITKLTQDAEFRVYISVKNNGDKAEAMALTYGIPSGWEIWNERLVGQFAKEFENRDIRDDCAKFYFGLASGATISYNLRLRAAYRGNFMLPPTVVEDMYNPMHKAITSNVRVEVK